MDVVLRFNVGQKPPQVWLAEAEKVIELFSRQPGFIAAKASLSLDEDHLAMLYLEFENVGAYRRALSAYDIKLEATLFLSNALDEPSAYEVLLQKRDGVVQKYESEKTSSSLEIALGDSATARAESRLEQ
jgi:hypothetical protein